MKKGLLKTPDVMYDFIYNLWFIYNELCMMGMGENPRNVQKAKTRKKFPVWLPSHPPSTKMEADCFPVSENTENKPELP